MEDNQLLVMNTRTLDDVTQRHAVVIFCAENASTLSQENSPGPPYSFVLTENCTSNVTKSFIASAVSINSLEYAVVTTAMEGTDVGCDVGC